MEVNEAEIDAALQELLHERHVRGDGCFGCGYGGFWTQSTIDNNTPFYRYMLKNILEAARPYQTQSVPQPTPQPSRSRYDLGTSFTTESSDSSSS